MAAVVAPMAVEAAASDNKNTIDITMRSMKQVVFIWAMLLSYATAAWGSGNVLHRHIANVTFNDHYVVVVEVYELTAGSDISEISVPIDARLLHPKGKLRIHPDSDDTLYEVLDQWDSNAPYSEKQNRCGLRRNADGTSSLCFGVQRNKKDLYFVSYALLPIARRTGTADVVDYPFVNHDASLPALKDEIRFHIRNRKIGSGDIDLKASHCDGGTVMLNGGTVYVVADASKGGTTKLDYQLQFAKGLFAETCPIAAAVSQPQGNSSAADSSRAVGGGTSAFLRDTTPVEFSKAELTSPMMSTSEPREEHYTLWDFICDHAVALLSSLFLLTVVAYYLIGYIRKKTI